MNRIVAKAEGKVHLTQSKAKLFGSMSKSIFKVNGIARKSERNLKKAEKEKAAAEAAKAAESATKEADSSGAYPSSNGTKQPPRAASPSGEDENPDFTAARAAAQEVDEAE